MFLLCPILSLYCTARSTLLYHCGYVLNTEVSNTDTSNLHGVMLCNLRVSGPSIERP